jgi:Spy/CpxP family protein refolding chaperone
MKHESLRNWLVGPITTLLLATLLVTAGAAQEPPANPGAEPPGKPAVTAPKERKKPRGRLPAYFAKVVTDKQREQIYEIQAKYNDQIAKLKEQLVELSTKRDSEVEQVLTDEQRAEIAKLKSQRRSRRAEPAQEDAAAENGQ